MAAPVLAYENLGLIQGSGWLFRGLDIFVGARDRLALIGRNGAGKTTLLKCLADMIETDEGRRTIQPGTRVVLLEQDPDVAACPTLRDFALAGGAALHEVEAIADQIGLDLGREAATAAGGERARAADKLDAKLKLELHWLQRGVTARRKRNQGRLAKLGEMRAARAAMLGAAGTAKLGLANDEVRTKMVIEADHVVKRFGDRTIVKDFSLRIQRGDRIGVVGANGTGKTTLLKLLTGDIAPDEGRVTRAKTLSGIMIDQQRRLLDPAKSVRDVLADGGDWIEVRGTKKHVQGYLKEFLFEPTLVDAKIGSLSGGERSRLLLAREFARASNLLVLDEPTNDLDMETLDLLQEVIADYDGTVLIVSHDRDFLDRTVTITLGLDGSGKVDIVAGGSEDWERKRRPHVHNPKVASPRAAARDERKPTKLTYKDQRDYDLLPARIDALEAEIARDEDILSDPDLYARDPGRFAQLTEAIDKARAEKDAAEIRWLELAEMAEALQA